MNYKLVLGNMERIECGLLRTQTFVLLRIPYFFNLLNEKVLHNEKGHSTHTGVNGNHLLLHFRSKTDENG
jgi:hypothetical protein